MKVKEVMEALERFAPLPLQEDYDNAGLQVGLTEAWEVSGALLCLDVTEEVVDEAEAKGCNLIVSHHPLIFRKLRHVSDTTMTERIVFKAIEKKIAIVSMHTNMDSAWGGVNFKIAEKMGLRDVAFLGETKTAEGVQGASGIMGNLPQPMEAAEFVKMLKSTFGVECVQANELLQRPISRVAVCGGAGAFLLGDAIGAGADAFVTGEMHYHDYFDTEQKIQIAVIGHYQSEQFTKELFKEIIERECPGVKCCQSTINTNPIKYI
ncbi:MAG: Nif3-like dinuclear metal center hexameric protein [Prevotella sp.]|nr:Nif3-like dinuclear metal center hexameric protein [Prevotella sp.]